MKKNSVIENGQEERNLYLQSEKAGLKFNVKKKKKTKIMVTSPITSRQIEGEKVKVGTNFLLLGSKITADGDCSHEIKRCLFLGRKALKNLDSILKAETLLCRQILHLVKAMVFPVVTYGRESWTINEAER